MKLLTALFFATTLIVRAQTIEVPHKLQFADLTLTIRDDARKEIQKDVDAFTRYPKSFNVKVERARTYFPIIEQIFAEEKVPDDFKYLVIQESALIPDAVSTSNAVGYWQFKDFTAVEMGLRVDRHVDERMNIVASTRAAAKYIKKNNTFFDNWLYALQAYQMGAGGAMRSVKDKKSGVKSMDVTSDTYWYVKKFLAHKIAYEGFTKGSPEVQLLVYDTRNNRKTLREIAEEVKIDEEQLKLYNKWVRGNSIPDDRSYIVALPVKGDPSGIKLPEAAASTASAVAVNTTVGLHENSTKAGTFKETEQRIKINNIPAIRGGEKDTPTILASRAGVDLSAFLKWNDLSISDRIIPGNYYLLGKKRSRSTTAYHKVVAGETLWTISQQYGVQLRKLRKYNRLSSSEDVRSGMTVWLSSTKPKDSQKATETERIVEVNQQETFAWDVDPAESTATTKEVITTTAPEIPTESTTPAKSGEAPREVVSDSITSGSESISEDSSGLAFDGNVNKPVDSTTKEAESKELNVVIETRVDSVNSVGKEPELLTPDVHIIKQGETLYSIARLYKVGVMDLVGWNGLDLQQGIKPGQVLKLKDPEEIAKSDEPSPDTNVLHEVKASDTVYSIARKYGVTIKELMEWNNKKDFNLAVGEKLRIKTK